MECTLASELITGVLIKINGGGVCIHYGTILFSMHIYLFIYIPQGMRVYTCILEIQVLIYFWLLFLSNFRSHLDTQVQEEEHQ